MSVHSETTWWLVCDECGARDQIDEGAATAAEHLCLKCQGEHLTSKVIAMFESQPKGDLSALPTLVIPTESA